MYLVPFKAGGFVFHARNSEGVDSASVCRLSGQGAHSIHRAMHRSEASKSQVNAGCDVDSTWLTNVTLIF